MKKKNVVEEIQDGWEGRIIPFDLVQKERVDRFICTLESLDYDSRYSPRVHNRILEKIRVDEDGNIEMHLKTGKVVNAKKEIISKMPRRQIWGIF